MELLAYGRSDGESICKCLAFVGNHPEIFDLLSSQRFPFRNPAVPSQPKHFARRWLVIVIQTAGPSILSDSRLPGAIITSLDIAGPGRKVASSKTRPAPPALKKNLGKSNPSSSRAVEKLICTVGSPPRGTPAAGLASSLSAVKPMGPLP